ncbi:Zinc finger CCCH domain-containing protein 49 [Forsythia ovata]|uniref:Zinc finger CCCH domain-containing protein 49 n=1 Tax=Forsythia ovata TaxID=205694 RepID=A0ABD1SPX5_9LAMI
MAWDYRFVEDPMAHIHFTSPNVSHYESALSALQRFLPSNKEEVLHEEDGGFDDFDISVDAFSCHDFRMFDFKVKNCARAWSHDWTECPFAHLSEKARRRDPRKYHYSGTACPNFRNGVCRKGDVCEYAHGVFECWLHPTRYWKPPCKNGTHCRHLVCFFAHTSK